MSCAVQNPPSVQFLVNATAPMELVSPYVIFWNPLAQFPLLRREIEICPHEEFYEWANGRTKSIQPRLLHDTQHVTLLVGAIYSCSETNHKVHSTDPRILAKLSCSSLPFHLLHRSGFTHEFVNYVVSLAKEGLPIAAIARHIQRLREEFAADIICTFVQCYRQHVGIQFSQEQNVYALYCNHFQAMQGASSFTFSKMNAPIYPTWKA